MPSGRLTDEQFIAEWHRHGSAQAMAKALNRDVRSIMKRRGALSAKGVPLQTRAAPGYESRVPEVWRDDGWTFERVVPYNIDTGSILIFSDAHYWPGEASVAHKAAIAVTKQIKPRAIVANGDIFDGVSVSRHDPFGWTSRPSVKEELEVCQERLLEFELAAPRGCELFWNIGNHDVRYERSMATRAPEFSGLQMMRLADHFPNWSMRWSTAVNWQSDHPVMIKHRNAGGVHAGYNNTLKGGVSIVTGHTHLLEAKPWGDYRGRRWGVQTGCLSPLDGPATEYTENGPTSACEGFAVLTFRDGILKPPELCEVIDGNAWFRGEVV